MHEDKFHDECAVVGVYGHPEAAKLTYLGLYALQHRGQRSTGIVASQGHSIHAEVGMGRVNDFFTEARLARFPGTWLSGTIAIPRPAHLCCAMLSPCWWTMPGAPWPLRTTATS